MPFIGNLKLLLLMSFYYADYYYTPPLLLLLESLLFKENYAGVCLYKLYTYQNLRGDVWHIQAFQITELEETDLNHTNYLVKKKICF